MICRIYKKWIFYYGKVYADWPIDGKSFKRVTSGHITKSGVIRELDKYKLKHYYINFNNISPDILETKIKRDYFII